MSFVLVSNRTSTVISSIVLAELFRLQSVGSGHFVPMESTILLQLWEILKSGNIVVIIDMKHRTFPEIQSQQGKASVLGLPYILLTLSMGKRPVLWSSLCTALNRGNSWSKHSPEAQLRGILLWGWPTPRILPSIKTSKKAFMFSIFSPIPDGYCRKECKRRGQHFNKKNTCCCCCCCYGLSLFETPASCGQIFSLCKVTSKYLSNFHVGLYIQTSRYRYGYIYVATWPVSKE